MKKFIHSIILIIKATLQLKKYNIGIYILLRFILDIVFIYIVNKIKYKKIKIIFYNHYKKKLNISFDWFQNNAQIWFFFLKKFQLFNKKISILEIGSFEGLSINYYYKFLNKINVTAVDPLDKTTKYFKNFKRNTKNLKNFNFFNLNAKQFFKKKFNKKYDLIYIDSSHLYKDVFFEGKESLKLLNKGGILIFDDLLHSRENYEYKNVIGGIILFLNLVRNIKIHYIGHQLIIQKI
jgi:hypothetical protein